MQTDKIVLPFEIYSALYGVGLLFDGFSSGDPGSVVEGPQCALGGLSFVDTGDPEDMWESDTGDTLDPVSEMVREAQDRGLTWSKNDRVVNEWRATWGWGSRMPVDAYFAAMNIVCEGEE